MCSFSMFNSFIKGNNKYTPVSMICEPHERPRSHLSQTRLCGYPPWVRTRSITFAFKSELLKIPAGDQSEGNWAILFREWLPRYFHVVNKGSILTDSGYASP